MKGRVKYVLIVILCMVLLYMRYVDYKEENKNEYIAKGDENIVVSEEWTGLITDSINKKGIKLYLDGKKVEFSTAQAYMDKKMSIMLPSDELMSVFDCSVNIYDGARILIEKAEMSMTLNLNSTVINVNGSDFDIVSGPLRRNGKIYIPLDALVDGMGYDFSWDSVENAGYLVGNKEFLNHLPSYYSYIDKEKAATVKNQLHLGTCWACASLTALETSLLPERNYLLSVDHMTLNNSFNLSQYDGGEYSMAIAYLTAWQGPVLEEDDPYADRKTDDTLEEVVHVQEVQMIEAGDFEEIKKAVYQYGGVETSIYMSLANSESKSKYYNSENAAYCYIGENKPNHDVVIIGWDDNYPKENFNADIEKNGAFICQNSWGEEFGNGGIIYISYCDSNIGMTNIVYTRVESVNNYDNNYQTDLCGYRGILGYDKEYAYFANAYTANGNEYLTAAGFYATGKNTEYTVYVCENFVGPESLTNKVAVATGSVKNAGYYTIDFDKIIEVEAGQKFAIIVYIKTPNSNKPVAVELVKDYASKKVDLEDGEGYISLNGITWDDTEEEQKCNVCLKCYTVNAE